MNTRTARSLHEFTVSENSLCSLTAADAACQLSGIALENRYPSYVVFMRCHVVYI